MEILNDSRGQLKPNVRGWQFRPAAGREYWLEPHRPLAEGTYLFEVAALVDGEFREDRFDVSLPAERRRFAGRFPSDTAINRDLFLARCAIARKLDEQRHESALEDIIAFHELLDAQAARELCWPLTDEQQRRLDDERIDIAIRAVPRRALKDFARAVRRHGLTWLKLRGGR